MPTGTQAFDKPDVRAVAEAISRPGVHALATNTARQHLRPGDATPTA
jgi:hypothetical protein